MLGLSLLKRTGISIDFLIRFTILRHFWHLGQFMNFLAKFIKAAEINIFFKDFILFEYLLLLKVFLTLLRIIFLRFFYDIRL